MKSLKIVVGAVVLTGLLTPGFSTPSAGKSLATQLTTSAGEANATMPAQQVALVRSPSALALNNAMRELWA